VGSLAFCASFLRGFHLKINSQNQTGQEEGYNLFEQFDKHILIKA